ncbi:MAG TPA: hypothetical protein VNA24_26165 [Hyalangium sp.]|nr:hypothetical protein [Hyalangium sp.]
MSEIIDAIVQVDVRALMKDHPDGWYYGGSDPSPLDKYYDVFVPERFADKRPGGGNRIICNVGDTIVFRALSRSGSGRYILINQLDVKAANGASFNRFISPPSFLTATGEGRGYGPAAARSMNWSGWDIMEWQTLPAPDRTEHFMQITALQDTLSQSGGGLEQEVRYTVGFTLRNDNGVWVKYQYDPFIKIRQRGTPYTGDAAKR